MLDDFRRAQDGTGAGSAVCSQKHTKVHGRGQKENVRTEELHEVRCQEREGIGHLNTGALNRTREIVSVGGSGRSLLLSIEEDNQARLPLKIGITNQVIPSVHIPYDMDLTLNPALRAQFPEESSGVWEGLARME